MYQQLRVTPPTKPFRKPYHVRKLVHRLKEMRNEIKAIINLQRNLSHNILKEFQSTNILIIRVEKRILTKRTLEILEIASEIKKLHPAVKIEYKILSIVLRHQYR